MGIRIQSMIGMIAVSVTMAFASYAHEGATGVVKERMETMKSIAQEMKKLKGLLFGTEKADAAKIREAASAIKLHAEKTPALFPEGSLKHPSQVSAKVWENFSAFEKDAEDLSKYAEALMLASGGSAPSKDRKITDKQIEVLSKKEPRDLFKSMAQTCQSCHKAFREKR